MASDLPYPCCDKRAGPIWLDGKYCRPVCRVHGYRDEPEPKPVLRRTSMCDLVEPETIEAYLRRKAKWVEPEFDIVEQHRLLEAADALAAKDAEIARLKVLLGEAGMRLQQAADNFDAGVKLHQCPGLKAAGDLVRAFLAKLEADNGQQ